MEEVAGLKTVYASALKHGVLALLMGLGLTMPLLGILGILGETGLMAAGILLVMTSALAAASVNRWALLGALGVMAVGAVGWLGSGGTAAVTEIARGVLLHLSGYGAVMPMIATEAAAMLAVLVALCCFGLTSRHAGPIPGIMVVLLVLLMLWFRGDGALVIWMIPALAAAVTMTATGLHGDGVVWPLLPWAAVICCAACLMIPAAGITAEPLESFAENLRQRIEDYLFYGGRTRTSFTLANEGYYTQGQTQMGGPAYPTEHAVMMVRAPRGVYLKGVSMNRYTGRMWDNTVRGKQYLWSSPLHRDMRARAFNMDLPSESLRQSSVLAESQVTVTLVAPNVSSLFVPQRMTSLTVGGDLVPYYNDAGEVFVNRDLAAGDTYTVTATLAVGGDAGLETILDAAASAGNDGAYAQILEDYTTLPEQFENPLYEQIQTQMHEKLMEAVGDARTPYQTALAIRNWLRANYRYELKIDPQNVDMDFVYSFLLGPERAGYCMHFASAMTVLCRMVGLPARYVEGYLAEPDSTGTAYVTGMDAHAWTEVYFEGYGWLTFDSTPATYDGGGQQGGGNGFPEPSNEPAESTPEPTSEPTSEPDQLPDPPEPTSEPDDSAQATENPTEAPSEPDSGDGDEDGPEQDQQSGGESSFPWWLLVLLAALGALTGRVVWTLPEMEEKRSKGSMARWKLWAQATHDALRVMKQPKRNGESPLSYLRRLAALGYAPGLLDDEGELEALVFYGRYEPTEDDADVARRTYLALWTDMSWAQKAKLMLLRAFVSRRKRAFTR